MRCFLFVRDPATLDTALAAEPDGIVLDLGRLEDGRLVAGFRRQERRGGALLLVQVGPFATADVEAEVEAAMACAPDGLLLREAVGARDVQRLGAMLAVAEATHGRPDGGTRILAGATDTAAGCLAALSVPGSSPRLIGLVCDGDRLAGALGCAGDAAPVGYARSVTVLAAVAAGVAAYAVFGTGDARALAVSARREGFAGCLTGDPGAIEILRDAFARVAVTPESAASA